MPVKPEYSNLCNRIVDHKHKYDIEVRGLINHILLESVRLLAEMKMSERRMNDNGQVVPRKTK